MYGKHALAEALNARPDVVRKVYLAPDFKDRELRALLVKHTVPTDTLKSGTEMVGREASHQGVVALINPTSLLAPFDTFIRDFVVTPKTALVVLGEVQDPHNVGAIIRSAAAFGLAGVLIPEHNQAGITGAVIKASAGMVFKIPLVSIGNVNATVRILKDKGFWIYGLDGEGDHDLHTETFDAAAAFIVGNEGAGIREKTLAACDIVLKIPMHERTESLNAAVSSAIVMYEWSTYHPASRATNLGA